MNGNGKYVNFQGNTPADPNDVIERVIWVKSDGLADHTSTSGWTSPAGLQPTATSSAGPTIAQCWQAINEYLTKFNGSQNNFTFLISYDEVFFEGLLDDYPGAAAAYSLRKLDKNYSGDAIRVRRASNNDEQDIGFDTYGDLDTSALTTFCSGTDGFVKVWYDQSGNGNDATQTTTSAQPKIYDSSTGVITENGKPIVSSLSGRYMQTGIDDVVKVFSAARLDTDGILLQYTSNLPSGSDGWLLAAENGSSSTALYHSAFSTAPTVRKNGASYSLSGKTRNDLYTDWSAQHLMYVEVPSTVGQNISFGYKWGPSGFAMYSHQEIILYPASSTHTPSDIETNINDYYSIY